MICWNSGSSLASASWTLEIGGIPAVALKMSRWTSSLSPIHSSSSLASFFCSGAIAFGMAQNQAARQASPFLVELGPSGNLPIATFPATLDAAGSLYLPYSGVSFIVMNDSPAMKIPSDSVRV